MKKQVIAIATLLAATAAQAQSQQAQVYVNAAGGTSHVAIECTGTTSCDSSDSGFKLMGGYNFGNGFSLEGGFISFGKVGAADATSSITLKPTALMLGGNFTLPLSTDWGMNFRLGIAQVKTKVDARFGTARGSESESKVKPYAGLGVTYALSQTVKLELAVDSTQGEFAGEKGTMRLISLGASFAF